MNNRFQFAGAAGALGFEFARQLRTWRRRRGLSQRELAELSGLSRTHISNLERNDNNARTVADPQLSTLYRLAAALDVAPAVLLPGYGVRPTGVGKLSSPSGSSHLGVSGTETLDSVAG
ncbi:helix-turn-helix domain-containing protein [Corynebacterium incognita]|uniref:helix-turn-helix domain-containing protein n=1 Tax=Corynebacterium incognita TaxID=2754725 RepID=UPI001FEC46C0|nr:helix-turn-helix transcriptional regulator [Corynebacterium incognita]